MLGRHSETSVFCLGLGLIFADPALNSTATIWPSLPRILPSGWSLCHHFIAQVWERGPGAALEPHIVNVILQALRGLWVCVAWGNGLGVLMVGLVMGFKSKALSQLLPLP